MARYSDVDLSFVMNHATHDIFRKVDGDSVKTALRNLILTNYGERKFFPEYGSGVYGSLFENSDSVTTYLLKSRIETAVAKYEPRVVLDKVTVKSDPNRNQLTIQLEFRIANINQPQTLNVALQRDR